MHFWDGHAIRTPYYVYPASFRQGSFCGSALSAEFIILLERMMLCQSSTSNLKPAEYTNQHVATLKWMALLGTGRTLDRTICLLRFVGDVEEILHPRISQRHDLRIAGSRPRNVLAEFLDHERLSVRLCRCHALCQEFPVISGSCSKFLMHDPRPHWPATRSSRNATNVNQCAEISGLESLGRVAPAKSLHSVTWWRQ